MLTQDRERGTERRPFSYLEVGDLPGDGLAELGQGVGVLGGGDHVVVPDGREALVAQQLLPDLGQAGLKLQLVADVRVGPDQDDGRHRSRGLRRKPGGDDELANAPCCIFRMAKGAKAALGPTLMLKSQGLRASTWLAPLLRLYTTR